MADGKGIKIAIDRGGTFTDVLGIIPGQPDFLCKLLSVDPSNYPDATIEGIRRVLCHAHGVEIPRGKPLDTSTVSTIRMGTTVATNALLERKGSRCALLITKGFEDLMAIGNQSRPKLFDLNIRKPGVLYEKVVGVDERVTLEAYSEDPLQDACKSKLNGRDIVQGVTGEVVRILKPLDIAQVTKDLKELFSEGFRSIAVCLAHGYNFQEHERQIGQVAQAIGFENISLSSSLLPTIKLVPRGHSTTADAYLTPETKKYVNNFIKGFEVGFQDHTRCEFMQSDGGLVSYQKFNGLRAILSGPAGGVVGYARTSFDEDEKVPVIGFDMGGTSTDVSRFGGKYEHVFESVTAGVHINCAQLDINTVAAGGGSMLFWRNGLFVVGPESAGAHPGPACYRKGGPLTITDANLVLGRLLPEYFPKIFGPKEDQPLGVEESREAFTKLASEINADLGEQKKLSVEAIALGFLNVANINMAKPIRTLTESRGYDVTNHNLASFGGAGGQHACDIAESLGIRRVVIHQYSSILSAYGMALADLVSEGQVPCSKVYEDSSMSEFKDSIASLKYKVKSELSSQGVTESSIHFESYLNMRYQGSDSQLMIPTPEGSDDYLSTFLETHQREFSFTNPDRSVIVDDIRVRGVGSSNRISESSPFAELKSTSKKQVKSHQSNGSTKVFFQAGWSEAPVYLLEQLVSGDLVKGPAMIIDQTQTIVVVPNAIATILSRHVIIDLELDLKKDVSSNEVDPIQLSIFGHRFMSIAEDMGRTLQKISVSTNVKERLDFSCALFDSDGGLTANAPHVPVHLGSMSRAVQIAMKNWEGNLRPGDVVATNHPISGGTHLPDITLISPVFGEDGLSIYFWVAARAHHAEIGGIAAGSMPSDSTELFQEGVAFEQWKIISEGKFDYDGVQHHFIDVPGSYPGCSPSRCLRDNIADLKAQVAANQLGISLVKSLFAEYGKDTVLFYMHAVKKTAELAVRKLLQDTAVKYADQLPLVAVDYMDDGTPIKLTVTIDVEKGEALFDFTGTGLETFNCLNAPIAITHSAILYSLRCMINIDIPMNQGCMVPITVHVPEGTLLNPSPTAAVCAGNGCTSQRITDVVLKAFSSCAASCGCMNILSFGLGGLDKDGKLIPGFGYGETIAGGSGAGPGWNGVSGTQVHMTNTKITDPEIMEKRYPVILRRFEYRPDSGGEGEFRGGDGLVREFEYTIACHASVLTQRRVYSPYGMAGGDEGLRGENLLGRRMKDGSLRWVNVGGTKEVNLNAGDRISIRTPGGGGYGSKVKQNGVPGSYDSIETKRDAYKEPLSRANGSLSAHSSLVATSF